ncbi:hypothetical protein GCM10008921_26070 [Metaclostridioides mangenotii]
MIISSSFILVYVLLMSIKDFFVYISFTVRAINSPILIPVQNNILNANFTSGLSTTFINCLNSSKIQKSISCAFFLPIEPANIVGLDFNP